MKVFIEDQRLAHGLQVRIVPPMPEEELMIFIRKHDIGLALEKSDTLNRDLCRTNKLYTYPLCGLWTIASNTSAQAEFLKEHSDAGCLIHLTTQIRSKKSYPGPIQIEKSFSNEELKRLRWPRRSSIGNLNHCASKNVWVRWSTHEKVLVIYPHWPPSNLVGVHRVRLIANHLKGVDWEPTVLCVDEKDYEEPLAWETTQLVNPEVRVVKVRARKPLKFWGKRLVGDIGLRGLMALYKQAKCLLNDERFDCIWISIPSWYPALLGAPLSRRFHIPFGLDYQDPWVHEIPQERKGLNRATLTIGLAYLLEPIALRRIAFISGISDGYLAGIKKRHSRLKTIPFVSAQLGFTQRDHHIELPEFKSLLSPENHSFVYAGAHWPMGARLFSLFLKALQQLKTKGLISTQLEFVFIGTGSDVSPSIAEQLEPWELKTW